MKKLYNDGADFSRVLILGYGGGSAAQIIHEEYQPDAEIVGVDADEKVLDLAARHFYTRGVKVVHSDAFDYIKQAEKNVWKYSLIVVDLFINELSPHYTVQQLKSFQNLLLENGKIIINTMCDDMEFKDLESKLTHLNMTYEVWNQIEGNRVVII